MVVICDKPYPKEKDIEFQEHFKMFNYCLSDFQRYAIEGIINGNDILCSIPTGSGKTLPAIFAINYFHAKGKKVIYTGPIKSLNNQKYYEFSRDYPHISFGLITGDIKIATDSSVLIMTTEILMNYLFASKENSTSSSFQIDIENELACVVLDEVHFINSDRGATWEKTILALPKHVQKIMLSGTIDSPEKFASWCEQQNPTKQVWLCSTDKRIVPLTHYGFMTSTEAFYKKEKDKALQLKMRLATDRLLILKDGNGNFYPETQLSIKSTLKQLETHNVFIKRSHVLNKLCLYLKTNDMFPSIAFVFSRKNVELFAKEITTNLLEDDSKIPYIVARECEQIVRKLPNFQEYMNLPEYTQLVSLLEKGIGIHHSGMIPILREIVELLISKKYIKILFATESFAIGLNCPIRSCIFSSLKKYDGTFERYLYAHEYNQAASRCGRRNLDQHGFVIHCNNLFETPTQEEYKELLCGKPQSLRSKFRISLPLILALMKTPATKENLNEFVEKSMIKSELEIKKQNCLAEIAKIKDQIARSQNSMEGMKTPSEKCEEFHELVTALPTFVNKKRKETTHKIQKLFDEHKHIKEDTIRVNQLQNYKKTLEYSEKELQYIETYIPNKIQNILCILQKNNFIEIEQEKTKPDPDTQGFETAIPECIPESSSKSRMSSTRTVSIHTELEQYYTPIHTHYILTKKGKIASMIAEINPIIASELLLSTDFLKNLSILQIIKFLTLFVDIKTSQETKQNFPSKTDTMVYETICKFQEIMKLYVDDYRVTISNDGTDGDLELNYDLTDIIEDWCNASNENQCKVFIQTILAERAISIGDFTKAVLKLSTTAKELIAVCEQFQEFDLLTKLAEIDGRILKYVATAQSLYV